MRKVLSQQEYREAVNAYNRLWILASRSGIDIDSFIEELRQNDVLEPTQEGE